MTEVKKPAFLIGKPAKQHHLNLLIYGNYGVGKTTLAATAQDVETMNDVLMINSESGDLSLSAFQKIHSIQVKQFDVLSQVYEFLRAHLRARDEKDREKLIQMESRVTNQPEKEIKEPKIFKTVIIDSLSEIDTMSMNNILNISENSKLSELSATAEWPEYKQNMSVMMRLIRMFRDLPIHTIFICAESFVQDESKKMRYSPALTGQLAKRVQGAMDMVGYMQIIPGENGSSERKLSVTPTSRYDAKHRYAHFTGKFFKNPTMSSILEEVGILDGVTLN